MSTDLPLVTVGIASFNNAPYLRETLESIRLQVYPHVEIIVVDDASGDGSVDIVRAWLNEHPEVNGRLICHETNLGVCRVCNDIVTNSKGEFISIVGSDDIQLPNKLSSQVPLLQNASLKIGVIFGDVEHINGASALIEAPVEWPKASSGDLFLPLLKVNFIPAMSTLVRRNCYDKVGLYDEGLGYEDWDMWLRIAREYQFLYYPPVTAYYRIHGNSATFKRRQQMLESSLKLLQKHRGHSPEADKLIANHTRQLAESLYQIGSKQARYWLMQAVWQAPTKLSISLLIMATLGIPSGKLGPIINRILGNRIR